MGLAVKSALWEGPTFKPCPEIVEGRAQKVPVSRNQGVHPGIIEQCGPSKVQADSEIRDGNVAVVQRIVKHDQ